MARIDTISLHIALNTNLEASVNRRHHRREKLPVKCSRKFSHGCYQWAINPFGQYRFDVERMRRA